MANEAYRAVFLRVHPTGKMVLSLTTESDGNESRYAQLVADELGVPALDVKVVPADTDRFGVGHGFNTSPSEGAAGRRSPAPRARSATRRSCSPGMALGAAPETLTWSNGAWVDGDGGDPTQVRTIADIALYAHGTGELPPGRRGRPRRAGRLPRLSLGPGAAISRAGRAASISTSTSSATFSAPNSAE